MFTIDSKEMLIREIANAMDGYSNEQDMVWCIDLTAQKVIPICDPAVVGDDCMPEDGHQMVNIDRVPSPDSFQIMENFTEECTSTTEQKLLYFALEQRHPFSTFKNAVYKLGIENNWFGYKAHALRKIAEEWMIDNKVDFIDGKIVCNSNLVYTYYRDEEI